LFFKKSRNITEYSDQELIAAFKESGNNALVGELYKRYSHLVFGVCMKYLKDAQVAEDLSMQVFEKLLLKLADQEIEHFKSWLYVLTKNECLMQLRKEKTGGKQRFLPLSEQAFMENEHWEHPDSEDVLEYDLVKLESCIGKLNQAQEVCIRLFYLEKKSYQEIEEQTGYELKKVKSYIQNGKRNLKICVESLREQRA